MRFINRHVELKELEDCYAFSKKRLFSVVIYGMRRVGKTELIKEFSKDKESIYFFVYDNKTSKALLSEYEEELKRRKIIEPLVRIETWENFADVLFEKCKNMIVVFDEFQNFREIYPAIFSVFQRKFDENKDVPMLMIFSGSIIEMIKRTFEDMKAPLYGRIKTKIKLAPLSYKDTKAMLGILDYKEESDVVEFYSIFGGVPKYYVAIEDFELNGKPLMDVLTYLFLRENAPFGSEVLDVLRQEFGKKKGTYYTILEAIATGHTKLNEIATYAGRNMTSITRYLNDLTEKYEMVGRIVPVTEDPEKTRKGTYVIRNPVMAFWFRYIHRNISLFEGKNFSELVGIIKKDLVRYEGRQFELVGREFFTELNAKGTMPFRFSKIGTWWGPYRDNEERKIAEIDIVALNEQTKEILFCECKWQDNVDAKKILAELKEKTKFVQWNNEKRKEHYAIFAKSFKEKIKEQNVMLFDLKDLGKA
ncbi:ATP-binding protein [archaeon]|nr:ATP-binding protein [Nanoarchaeota archaeon]MBU4451177.1 ATP-binding protein [Nanoarchaeota archaeon]MCG2724320.1 ATP-binding protein [archaeon]